MIRSCQVVSMFILALVPSAATTGCKTCETLMQESSASGALTYTESVATQDARVDRINFADGYPDVVAANRARGRERITEERRVPENMVSSSVIGGVRTIVVESRLSTAIGGGHLVEPISLIELRITRPERGAAEELRKLDAVICERFYRRSDAAEECTGASGTIDFHRRERGFSADVRLEAVGASDTDATLEGNLHLEFEEIPERDVCGGLDVD